MNTSVHHSDEICKRLSENNLLESVKAVSESYIISIMLSMFQAGYHGKTVDMENCSDRHRTSISRFLRNESICDDKLAVSVQQYAIKLIYDECIASGRPIFLLQMTRSSPRQFHHQKPSIRWRPPVFTFLI